MTVFTLVRRSLRFHARSHLGVLLGSAVGSAALLGALVVGDSVRESLRRQGLQRLGQIEYALAAPDRLFRSSLAQDLASAGGATFCDRTVAAVLSLPATATLPDGSARANQVHLLGVDGSFDDLGGRGCYRDLPPEGVVLNERLAAQLKVKPGDTLVLRVRKPSALSREAIVSPQSDTTVALRLPVSGIAPDNALGNFSLRRSQMPPFNAFVAQTRLQEAVEAPGRANLLLLEQGATPPPAEPEDLVPKLQSLLGQAWQLADAELEVQSLTNQAAWELRSPRIFLDPPVTQTVLGNLPNVQPVLTYLVNQFQAESRATPYSMVSAVPTPLAPAGMANDEILVNQWLADDLGIQAGDPVALSYFLADSGTRLQERTNQFRVHGVVPMSLPYADPTLMPEFPGIAQAESTHDWDAGFPLVHPIREKDDAYWQQWRGTPKAFVTLEAGQAMWGNRFGNLTAIRFPNVDHADFGGELSRRILAQVKPEAIGLQFEPVRRQALAAANESQDFGGLFLGFSFFLVVAALILMALLFQFGLETRLGEVGTLLAVGFTPGRVRWLLLLEGGMLAMAGGALGVLGGAAYAKALLLGLTTLWRDAVGTSALEYHARGPTYLAGLVAAVMVSSLTIALVLRKQVRRPARALLAEESGLGARESSATGAGGRRLSLWLAGGSTLAAAALMVWSGWQGEPNPGLFFGAGSLLLLAGLSGAAQWLNLLSRSKAARSMTVTAMGLRSMTRQRKRSLASIALLACGSFLIVAVGANRLDANLRADQRSSGTGGFALLAESTLPVLRDLNQAEGLEFYGLNTDLLPPGSVVPLRVQEGDDASCLNLNRAQKPRLLGVNPERLDQRQAFTFAKVAPGLPTQHPWLLLRQAPTEQPDVIPAIGDQNSILWALGKQVGDTLDYTDERGRPFQIRLVGAVANSILQGSLLIDETAFQQRFPGVSGYRMLLIDAPSDQAETLSAALSRALEDAGVEVTLAVRRLEAFNAVQNTYLNTFQVLGGIGLLLGSAGLGVVVLRNVLERRGELALLQAVGFRRRRLRRLILAEHGALLALGLVIGVGAALVAVMPVLLRPGGDLPAASLSVTLLLVLGSGAIWTWLATNFALRGDLLPALRRE